MLKAEEVVVEPQVRGQLSSKAGVLVLLTAVAVALVLPVWIVQYPPLLDFPNHLARSYVLSHLHDPTYHYDRWYSARWGPYPYVGMDIVLIALQHLFPIQIAAKVFLSLCLLGVPLCFWWFLRQANPGNDWLAAWALLAACNEFFLESFLAFQLSVAVGFLALGFWVRWSPRPTVRRWLLLLLMTTATYFAHLIGFILIGFVVTAYSLLERRGVRELLRSWLLFVPGVIMFVISGLGVHNGRDIHFRTFDDKVDEIIRTFFGGYSARLTTATLWIAILCIVLAWVRNRDFRWKRPWPLVALALLALYLALPYALGETFDIDVRVLPVLFLAIPAVANVGRRARALGAVALLLFAVRTVSVARTFIAEQPELESISRGVQLIRQGALVLPIVEPREDDDPNRWSYEHFSAWAVIQRGAFSPYLFDLPGQTPMRISYDVYSPDAFWDSAYADSDVDWQKVQEQYDYVWAYNVDHFTPKLKKIGKRIYRDGAFQLYEIDKPK